jgi:uncharacterized membrane protein YiaA
MSKLEHIRDPKNNDRDADEELQAAERKIGLALDVYDVEYPSESEIATTIDAIRPYVPMKTNQWKTTYAGMSSIMKQTLREVLYISPIFWIINGVLLLIGLAAVVLSDKSPYLVLMMLAPLPTLTGVLEVLKSRNAEMAELEMSFKYSLQEIILSKMAVIGVFNLLINIMFTIGISYFDEGIWIWKLILYWVTPFTVITALSFVLVSRYRHIYAATAGLIVWIGFGIAISQSHLVEKIESIPAIGYAGVAVAATLFVIMQIRTIYTRGVRCDWIG